MDRGRFGLCRFSERNRVTAHSGVNRDNPGELLIEGVGMDQLLLIGCVCGELRTLSEQAPLRSDRIVPSDWQRDREDVVSVDDREIHGVGPAGV